MESVSDSLEAYIGYIKESDYASILKGHCLVHGCVDCSHHRRGVTNFKLSRKSADHADAMGILAGFDVPIILRYVLYCVIPCIFKQLIYHVCQFYTFYLNLGQPKTWTSW